MKTVILCGGQGSRIRDISEAVPKPMLTIGERPILWHIMKHYANHGVKDFVLALGYKGWTIKEYFLNYRYLNSSFTVSLGDAHRAVHFHGTPEAEDWRVTLVDTGENTMTGGRVRRIREHVAGEECFCLTYGDAVADVDIGRLLEQHKASGLVATLSAVRLAGRFGELHTESGRVVSFEEKPAVTAGRVSGGFMVFDAKRIWDYIDDSDECVLEREPLSRLVADGQLGCYEHNGRWQCMDTPREYALLNELWRKGDAFWAAP